MTDDAIKRAAEVAAERKDWRPWLSRVLDAYDGVTVSNTCLDCLNDGINNALTHAEQRIAALEDGARYAGRTARKAMDRIAALGRVVEAAQRVLDNHNQSDKSAEYWDAMGDMEHALAALESHTERSGDD